MKLARLYQPRNPLFWIMVALNVVSGLLAWITRSYDLAWFTAVVITVFAVGNAVLGTYLMWRLVTT